MDPLRIEWKLKEKTILMQKKTRQCMAPRLGSHEVRDFPM